MNASPTQRYNSAYDDWDLVRKRPLSEYWHADFRPGDLEAPYARTKLRRVCRGKYTAGPDAGVKCVIKYFRRRYEGATEADYSNMYQFNNDIAHYVIDNWNNRKTSVSNNIHIRVGTSYLWEFWNMGNSRRRKPCVVEPYIRKYYRWNSNSGWADTHTPWGRLMQAVSHYSYDLSGGNLVLCELQGGFSQRSKTPILVSPAVASRESVGGVTDLGPQGIYTFFRNHTCNEYCSKRWLKPDFSSVPDLELGFRRKRGTTYWDYQKNSYL